jgi:DNA-binding IscR family transcriptional regulator
MNRDSRLSSVLHALLHMADAEAPMTSQQLAVCMGTHPVVVRRTMAHLREAGLVRSGKGPGGGWSIACDLATVTLRDVHAVLGEPAVFAIGNHNDRPACLVEQSVNAVLDDAFQAAEALLLARFQAVTLASLAAEFSRRFAAHRAVHPLPPVEDPHDP